MKKLTVAFFTEAGTSRGMGHLIRSHAISDTFKSYGLKVSFFLDSDIDYSKKFNDIISFEWFNFKLKNSYDIIFIDSYEATIDVYEKISNNSKIAVYIDDFGRLDYPKGTILNIAPDAKKLFFNYKKEKNFYLLGLKYVPIRDIFISVKNSSKEEKKIFIMLGGSDIANLSTDIVKTLDNIDIQKIIVVNNYDISKELELYRNTTVLYKPTDKELAISMASCNIAISTASMSVYELTYFNIPTIIIAIEGNQEIGAIQLIEHNLALYYVSIKNINWLNEIEEKVNKLINYTCLNKKCIIDGKGKQRLFENIMEMIEK